LHKTYFDYAQYDEFDYAQYDVFDFLSMTNSIMSKMIVENYFVCNVEVPLSPNLKLLILNNYLLYKKIGAKHCFTPLNQSFFVLERIPEKVVIAFAIAEI